MKNLLVVLAMALITLGGYARLGFAEESGPGARGVAVEMAPACLADTNKVYPQDIALLDRWIDLTAKKRAGTLTEEEESEGYFIWKRGICVELRPDVEAIIVLVAGRNALVDLCVPEECVRVIMKTQDVILDR